MGEQWIPAAQALELVSNSANNIHERLALCDRANAGLVKTRARLLIIDSAKREHTTIPSRFWWAKGHEALNQDWSIGDFSTSIERREHWRAYGVSFALGGLLEMIPVERRAATARALSVVGSSGWLSALEARRFAYEKAGRNPMNAGTAIIDGGKLGFIAARAVMMRRATRSDPDEWTEEVREWDIPEWFWENFTTKPGSTQDWERGVFAGDGLAPDKRCWITLTGVYFLADSLNVMLPLSVSGDAADKPAPNPGGRPRKEFWDDLWCSVWGQIYHGELAPKRQADIERAMLTWVEAKGHNISESTIKPLARKMFAEMAREDINS
ncbi:MAG: hypothetical protein ABIT09_06945 [Croceibacterium sp.]